MLDFELEGSFIESLPALVQAAFREAGLDCPRDVVAAFVRLSPPLRLVVRLGR